MSEGHAVAGETRTLSPVVARAPARQGDGKWLPGSSGNPNGKAKVTDDYRRCRELCRQRSVDAAGEIIRLFQHSDDDRVRFMAAQWCYKMAWGEPLPYDPSTEKEPSALDLSKLSADQRQQLRELLTKAVAKPDMGAGMGSDSSAAATTSDNNTIDGSQGG
jgi:hypothetical protein